jgi:hypothetical protein
MEEELLLSVNTTVGFVTAEGMTGNDTDEDMVDFFEGR